MIHMIRRKIAWALDFARLGAAAALDLARYPFRGELGHGTWEILLRLHCMTNGRSTAIARRVVRRLKPPPAPIKPFDSLLGKFDAGELARIAEQIRRDGYYVFPARLADSICDKIAAAAGMSDDWTRRNGQALERVGRIDPDRPVAHRYEMPEPKIWEIPAYQTIIADPLFVNLSQAYFGAVPALKEANLWWSPAMDNGRPDDDAAQMFHFDYDAAPVWLKFFVYLSDVTPQTGPHVFVKGSHRPQQDRARDLIGRGYVRVGDDEIARIYGAESIIKLAGLKGTVFVADTLGFHKGEPPLTGHRLMAQLEFATPFFVPVASHRLPMPANASPGLLAARAAYPWAFKRFPAAP
jgi:hypothetical protein